MRTQRWFWSGISLVFVMAMFATSCGGGTTGVPGPGPGDPPINPGSGPVSNDPNGPKAEPLTGVLADAPLGTTPEYNMTPIVPVEVSSSATSRATSALAANEDYKILSATVTLSNVTNPSLVTFPAPNNLQFEEGKTVNLWIRYETRANKTFTWTWTVSAAGNSLMNYTADRTETTAGIKTTYLQLYLPFDEASNLDLNAVFKCEFKAKTSSVVVIPPDGNSVSVDFVIKNVPVDIKEYGNEGGAFMCWEDLLVDSDFDYNDFLAGIYAKELMRQSDGKVVQISFTVKAIARGAGYDSDWQFNMDSAFPGATASAYIQRYSYNNTPKGSLQAWTSSQGTSIPVFVSNKTSSLPIGPNGDGFSTNVKKDSTWVNGDYAKVTIVFNSPLTPGTFTPIPYKPQLRVRASSTNVYVIPIWTRRGDPTPGEGKRPLGFIIPGNFAWMMEGRQIWIGYPRFDKWVTWIETGKVDGVTIAETNITHAKYPDWWTDAPVKTSGSGSSLQYNTYQKSLFKGSPPDLPVSFPLPD